MLSAVKEVFKKNKTLKPVDGEEDEPEPVVVTRAEWGARAALDDQPMEGQVTDVTYTDTDSLECCSREECVTLLQKMQHYHMDVRGLTDIQYNFIVGGDGSIYEGRGWRFACPENPRTPSKTKTVSGKSIEIAFIGKYKDKEPSDQMFKLSAALLKQGMDLNYVALRPLEKEETERKPKELEVEEKEIEVPPGTLDRLVGSNDEEDDEKDKGFTVASS